MAEFGFKYRSVSTYSTVRNPTQGPVIKPLVPFTPNTNGNSSSEGYVTKKTVVPVTSRPYGGDDDDDHNPAPDRQAYQSRGDDDWRHQTSPVRGSPRKVDDLLTPTKVKNEASHPQRLSPLTPTDRRHHSPQPTTGYNGTNHYGNNKEEHKPIGGTIRNNNHDDYDHKGTNNGHGDYGRDHKEGHKPIGGTIRNNNHDGYDHNGTNNGYGDFGSKKEGHRPIGGTIRNDNSNGPNSPSRSDNNGSNKERRKPIGSTIRNDNSNGTSSPSRGDNYGSNKERRKPIGGGYDYNGTNNDQGDYGRDHKEGQKPFGSTIRKENYDGTNNGFGGYGSPKEGHKPFGSTARNDHNHGGHDGTKNGYGDYGSNMDGSRPIGGTNRNNHNHGGYDGPSKGYGDYGSNKEGHKPFGSTIKNDHNHGGYNNGAKNGYGDYGSNKDGSRPIGGSTNRNDIHSHGGYNGTNGYGDYGRNKDGRRPIGITIHSNNYDSDSDSDGYDVPDGYGDYSKNEGHKQSIPIRTGNYDGYGTVGIGNNREKQGPFGSNTGNNRYHDDHGYGVGGLSRPNISSGWTAAPRRGTQLSEPTHDINVAMELLRMEAAKVRKTIVKEPEMLRNIVTGTPPQSRYSVPNKDNEYERRDVTMVYGNFKLPSSSSSPRGYEHSSPDSVMDSREAEKRFRGARVW